MSGVSNGYRQEVFNVLLAQLLQERGVISAPENVVKATPRQARRIPDVIVNFYGLRTAIEGEVGDQPDAQAKAVESARRRVVEGIAHIGVGVVYPAELRAGEFADLKERLAESPLWIAVVTEDEEGGIVAGSVDDLERALRTAFEHLVQEDVVAKAVAELDAAVEKFAAVVMAKPGVAGRLAQTLDIRDLPAPEDSAAKQGELD